LQLIEWHRLQIYEAFSFRGKDPYKFLYDAAKGLWGHHNKLDANVV